MTYGFTVAVRVLLSFPYDFDHYFMLYMPSGVCAYVSWAGEETGFG